MKQIITYRIANLSGQICRQVSSNGIIEGSDMKRIDIRMTPAEISALDKLAMASGMNRSRYIRRLISIEKKDIFLKEENIKDLQTQFENINRLGTNIHQIAFNINMDRAVNYDIKKIITPLLQDISSNIKELKTQLVNLIKEHRG